MAKILIIEDESAYQKILKDTFEKAGFKVLLAFDGKEGIIEATINKPDFILLDLIMPGMNGSTFLRHKDNMEELESIPVGILTAVPDGVPQNIDGSEPFKNIVGFWVKDQQSLPELVQNVKSYLTV